MQKKRQRNDKETTKQTSDERRMKPEPDSFSGKLRDDERINDGDPEAAEGADSRIGQTFGKKDKENGGNGADDEDPEDHQSSFPGGGHFRDRIPEKAAVENGAGDEGKRKAEDGRKTPGRRAGQMYDEKRRGKDRACQNGKAGHQHII